MPKIKPETVTKAVLIPIELVERIEKKFHRPGQNFKWAPFLLHLVEREGEE